MMKGAMRRGLALAVVVVTALAGCGGSRSEKRTQDGTAQVRRQSPPAVAATHRPALIIQTLAGTTIAGVTVNKGVNEAVADPNGGWFIAGAFTRVDGVPAPTLARLLPSGAVDRSWLAVRAHPYYLIDAIAAHGDELLVARETGVGAGAPSCLSAYNAKTGAPWPGFRADIHMTPELGCINALAPAGPYIYVAGFFNSVNAGAAPGLARLYAATGAVDHSWRPTVPSCAGVPGAPRGPSGCDGDFLDVRPIAGAIVATDGFLKQHAYSPASGTAVPLPAIARRQRHSPKPGALAVPVRSGSRLLMRAR
jgi:hypothetical protein